MFLLSQYITKTYWGSIIAGFIFTFSNFHFAHAEGHLQLVSLEWIPLFMLCFYILVTKPTIFMAISSAVVLYAVILCDYYYFFYCVLSGIMLALWRMMIGKDLFLFLRKKYLVPLLIFLGVTFVTSGILVYRLLLFNIKDPFLGAHESWIYSTDLLAPFIPGGHWRFADLTKFYWSRLPGNINESSVYIGLSVIYTVIFAWIKRRNCGIESLRFWYLLLFVFFFLSLGPVLHLGGVFLPILMPYTLLERGLPFIKLSGSPIRMMVMVVFSAAIICAFGFKIFFQSQPRRRILAGLLLLLLFIEYLPKSLPSSSIPIPKYVTILKTLPDDGGVVDLAASPPLALYYQTIHNKPMAFGYVSRIPTSIREKEKKLIAAIQERDYLKLFHDYNLRYLVCKAPDDTEAMIYDLSKK